MSAIEDLASRAIGWYLDAGWPPLVVAAATGWTVAMRVAARRRRSLHARAWGDGWRAARGTAPDLPEPVDLAEWLRGRGGDAS